MAIDGVSRSAGSAVRQLAERPVEKAAQPQVQANTVARAAPQVAKADVFEAKSTQTPSPVNIPESPQGAHLPAIKPNTNTVQAGTVTLDDKTKQARGALKIEPGSDGKIDPKKYDGMYLGSDGYAYPPDKFKVSEVPPFKPEKPVSNPPPTTYYTNGILTQPLGDDNASGEAQKLANKTGTNVVLVYNATEGLPADVTQTGLDRLNVGDNKAANTLANAIYNDIKAGKQVNVTGYSQGGAIVSSALRKVDEHISNDQGGFWANLPVIGDDNRRQREALLSNINVTTFAGAGKTFPNGPRYNFYVNNQDPVPTWLGSHGLNPVTDTVSGIVSGLFPIVGALNGGSSIQWPPGSHIHSFDTTGKDPSNVFSVEGKHGFNTYLSNIQDTVP